LCEIGASGEPEPLHGGVDIFAYPRGFWSSIPPYLLGRGRWDSGLILEARRKAAPVVDITPSITALHPKHGYTRHPEDTEGLRREELAHNAAILGGAECIYSAVNSTHVLRNDTLKRFLPRHPLQLLRRLATASAIVPALRPLSPLVRWLGPRLRSIQPSTPDADLPWIMD
jgi:hypothetical protein